MNLGARRTNVEQDDQLKWSIVDYKGRRLRSGAEKIAEGEATLSRTIVLKGLPSGYLELHAELVKGGAKLPRCGSRPEGIATFGVTSPWNGCLWQIRRTHASAHRVRTSSPQGY